MGPAAARASTAAALVGALGAALAAALVVSGPAAAAAPAGPAAPRGAFGWPLAGTPVVERHFDPPRSAYGAGHRGVDLRGSLGQLVRAAGPGRVSYAGLLAGRGVVAVTHANGLRTTYEPVDAQVEVGQRVRRGQPLGRLSTGHASCRRPTCLHWGLRRGAAYLNPLSLLRPPELRLLPLHGPPAPPAAPPPGRSLRSASLPMSPPATSAENDASRLLVAAAAVAGPLVLGSAAWRRQDARGQQGRRP